MLKGWRKQTNKQKGQKSMVTVRLSLVHVCCDFRSMAIKGKSGAVFRAGGPYLHLTDEEAKEGT